MTDFDSDFRTALTVRADDAPAPDGLLTAVRARSRRAQRRRRWVAAACTALVLVAGVGVAGAVIDRDDNRDTVEVTDSSVPTPPPSPVDVGWLPEGFEEPVVRLLGPDAWALESWREDPHSVIDVQVMAGRPALREKPGTVIQIEVDGIPGELYRNLREEVIQPRWGLTPAAAVGPYYELVFERRPGQWIRILGQSIAGPGRGLTQDDLVAVAESLEDRARAVPDALRVEVPGELLWCRLLNDRTVTAEFGSAASRRQAVHPEDLPNAREGSAAGPGFVVKVGHRDDEERRGAKPAERPLAECGMKGRYGLH